MGEKAMSLHASKNPKPTTHHLILFIEIALLLGALALSALHFTHALWWHYAVDAPAHLDYILFFIEYGGPPPIHGGAAYRHPMLYYKLASLGYGWGGVNGVRALSFLSAVALAFIGRACIHLVLGRGAGALVALAIFLYWPLFPTLGARITPDILLTAILAGVFYAILRWREAYAPQHLGMALALIGLATLAKNGALMWLAFLGMVGLWALLSKRMQWSQLFAWQVWLGTASLVAAFGCMFARARHMDQVPIRWRMSEPPLELGNADRQWFDLRVFFESTVLDINTPAHQFLFGNLFVRMLALDQFPWPVADGLQLIICVFVLLLLPLSLLAWWWGRRASTYPCMLLFFFLSQIILLLAIWLWVPNPYYANPRYIYLITLFIALFIGAGTQASLQRGTQLLAGLGVGLAASMVALTSALILASHLA